MIVQHVHDAHGVRSSPAAAVARSRARACSVVLITVLFVLLAGCAGPTLRNADRAELAASVAQARVAAEAGDASRAAALLEDLRDEVEALRADGAIGDDLAETLRVDAGQAIALLALIGPGEVAGEQGGDRAVDGADDEPSPGPEQPEPPDEPDAPEGPTDVEEADDPHPPSEPTEPADPGPGPSPREPDDRGPSGGPGRGPPAGDDPPGSGRGRSGRG
ncbi:MAG: hypothetical protein JJT89_09705 [Nitriliruptoraceae bacterium]|nr:hypothetical protein [Nitriliruptoraceae bacterium]